MSIKLINRSSKQQYVDLTVGRLHVKPLAAAIYNINSITDSRDQYKLDNVPGTRTIHIPTEKSHTKIETVLRPLEVVEEHLVLPPSQVEGEQNLPGMNTPAHGQPQPNMGQPVQGAGKNIRPVQVEGSAVELDLEDRIIFLIDGQEVEAIDFAVGDDSVALTVQSRIDNEVSVLTLADGSWIHTGLSVIQGDGAIEVSAEVFGNYSIDVTLGELSASLSVEVSTPRPEEPEEPEEPEQEVEAVIEFHDESGVIESLEFADGDIGQVKAVLVQGDNSQDLSLEDGEWVIGDLLVEAGDEGFVNVSGDAGNHEIGVSFEGASASLSVIIS